jgi:minor extracellular serine protease Vpr
MRKWSLRLVLALLCVAGLAVAPAGAGDGRPLAGSVGGAANESATKWFVELASPPSIKGTSKEKLKAERDAFKANAAAEGVNLTERRSFDTLWNGLSVSVPSSQVGALGTVPGVKAVYPVHTVSLPQPGSGGGAEIDLKNAVGQTGADVAQNDLGFDGSDVTIAIMDSGLDYTLPEFGGCFGPACKVRGGFDLVGDSYNASPSSPAFQPIPHPDLDPLPCDPNFADAQEAAGAGTSDAAHGTHVAGIAAADGRGHTAEGQVVGVAPGAKLLAYRVFGCNGSTDTDVMIDAMERALADHADVLNMSIGSAFSNWPQSPEAVASDNLVDAGVVVVASIGNSGANGGQLWSAGSPGVGQKVIGVASFDNTKATLPAFSVGGNLYGYNRAAAAPLPPLTGSGPIQFTGTPLPPTPTPNDGCTAFTAGSLSGKIAFIRRGTCGFYNKAINAQTAGAIAVVLYNNVAGRVSPTVAPVPPSAPGVTIPVVAITAADAETIFSGLAGASTLMWTDQTVEAPIPTANLVSNFSSFGTDAELRLKPDIGAPGGQIYSTWPHQQFGGHNTISGTSMSSPHVAGLAALILDAKNKNISPSSLRTILMNTASPRGVNIAPPGAGLEPTWRQGAGLAYVPSAILTTSWVTPSKISLGEGTGGAAELTITNSGSAAVTYDLSAVSTIATGPTTVPSNPLAYPFVFSYCAPTAISTPPCLVGPNSATFSSPSVTVPAGGTATVGVNITANSGLRDKSLYGGYVVLTPQGGDTVLRVPYAGFFGDYQSLPVITSAGCGLPTLARFGSSTDAFQCGTGEPVRGVLAQPSGGTWEQPKQSPIIVFFHFNHQAANYTLTLLDAATGQPVTVGGRIPVVESVNLLPRNSAVNTFFASVWDGTLAFRTGSGQIQRKAAPGGVYKLKLTITKAIAINDSRAAGTESWTSPAITLRDG